MRPFALATLLTSQVTALRVGGETRRASPDIWGKIADGLRLPTEGDVAESLGRSGNFDYRAWGAEFDAKTFTQQVDHVNAYHQQTEFLDSSSKTFEQRYWINTKAWAGAKAKGPIFVIISPYGGFSTYAYGYIGEMAREMGAMVVQVEGRFSPESLPFNASGYDPKPNRMGLMSSENGVRDYIMLISYLRSVFDPDWVCPTATFGTSLAGMYAAWLRYKFPHIIDMALASGSPMTGYPGTSDGSAFTRVVTEAWEDTAGGSCVELIRDSFKALAGDPCHDALWSMVYNEATYRSYPPLGRMDAACDRANEVSANGGSDVEVALALCGDACGECGESDFSPTMWGYFSCTQVVNPIESNGVTDFFWPPAPWNVEDRRSSCMKDWGIEPQVEGDYHAEIFGFHHLSQLAESVNRMLFAFGSHDAWTGFALTTTDISPELPVVVAKGGTHGGDLLSPRSDDTEDMLAARAREKSFILRWVQEVQARHVVRATTLWTE